MDDGGDFHSGAEVSFYELFLFTMYQMDSFALRPIVNSKECR